MNKPDDQNTSTGPAQTGDGMTQPGKSAPPFTKREEAAEITPKDVIKANVDKKPDAGKAPMSAQPQKKQS